MTLSAFRLVLHANGGGQVLIGDTDLSDMVGAIALNGRPGEPPRLIIELIGEAEVDGVGDVTVIRRNDVLAEFFSNVDADELEKEALGRLEGFGDTSTTQKMLDILKEWVSNP